MVVGAVVVAAFAGIVAPLVVMLVDYSHYCKRRTKWDADFPKPQNPLDPKCNWNPEYYRPTVALGLSAVLVVFASAVLVGALALHGVPLESSWVRHTNVLIARLGVCVLLGVLAVLGVWAVVRMIRVD